MAGKTKLQADELYASLMSFWGADGAWVPAGSQWRGDHPVVRLHPGHFSRVRDGQSGIDKATRALLEAASEAQRNRELQWYGTPQSEPEQPPRRAIAVKSFEHGDLSVKVGDIFPSDALVVAQVNHAFVIAED